MSSEKMEFCEGVTENTADVDESLFTFLPVELFLHICSYLSVKDMIVTLSRVCKRFHEILNDENIWKAWIQRRWGSKYPIINIETEFHWKEACLEIEREWRFWTGAKSDRDHIIANDIHISSVDAVVFLDSGETCISGARDRSLVTWSPLKVKESDKQPYFSQKDFAHEGWIWRLLYSQNNLYSCSWDTTVKVWTISEDIMETHRFKCQSPVLSMTVGNEGLVYAGEYAKSVHGFDPRSGLKPVVSYVTHNRAVLTLGTNDKDVISGSEDKTLVVWDKRARSVRQKIELGKPCYPNCSSIDDTHVFIGDNKGSVHVFSAVGVALTRVATFQVGHSGPVSVVKHSVGHLITGAQDGVVNICLPTNPPSIIHSVKCNGPVGGLDYVNGILGVGASTAMEFWVPKTTDSIRM